MLFDIQHYARITVCYDSQYPVKWKITNKSVNIYVAVNHTLYS